MQLVSLINSVLFVAAILVLAPYAGCHIVTSPPYVDDEENSDTREARQIGAALDPKATSDLKVSEQEVPDLDRALEPIKSGRGSGLADIEDLLK